MRRILGLIAYSSGLGVLGKLVQFLALAVVAFVLSPAEYGYFAIVQIALFGVASIASSSFGIAANLTAGATDVAEQTHLLRDAAALVARGRARTLLVAATAGAVVTPALISVSSARPVEPWMFAVGLMGTGVVVVEMFLGALAGYGRVRTVAIFDAVRGAGSGAAALAGAALGGVVGAAFGLLLIDVAIAIFVVSITILHAHTVVRPVAVLDRQTLSFGVAANTVAQVTQWLLVTTIQLILGPAAVGAFALANRFATLVLLPATFLTKNLLGELSRVRRAGGIPALRRTAAQAATSILGISIAGSGIATLVALTVFGSLTAGYEGFTVALGILLIASSLRAVATALGVACIAAGRRVAWLLSDVAALAVFAGAAFLTGAKEAGIGELLMWFAFSNGVTLAVRVIALSTMSATPPGGVEKCD